jgi:hypothetical protein
MNPCDICGEAGTHHKNCPDRDPLFCGDCGCPIAKGIVCRRCGMDDDNRPEFRRAP